jgi:hypothetical protein
MRPTCLVREFEAASVAPSGAAIGLSHVSAPQTANCTDPASKSVRRPVKRP